MADYNSLNPVTAAGTTLFVSQQFGMRRAIGNSKMTQFRLSLASDPRMLRTQTGNYASFEWQLQPHYAGSTVLPDASNVLPAVNLIPETNTKVRFMESRSMMKTVASIEELELLYNEAYSNPPNERWAALEEKRQLTATALCMLTGQYASVAKTVGVANTSLNAGGTTLVLNIDQVHRVHESQLVELRNPSNGTLLGTTFGTVSDVPNAAGRGNITIKFATSQTISSIPVGTLVCVANSNLNSGNQLFPLGFQNMHSNQACPYAGGNNLPSTDPRWIGNPFPFTEDVDYNLLLKLRNFFRTLKGWQATGTPGVRGEKFIRVNEMGIAELQQSDLVWLMPIGAVNQLDLTQTDGSQTFNPVGVTGPSYKDPGVYFQQAHGIPIFEDELIPDSNIHLTMRGNYSRRMTRENSPVSQGGKYAPFAQYDNPLEAQAVTYTYGIEMMPTDRVKTLMAIRTADGQMPSYCNNGGFNGTAGTSTEIPWGTELSAA